MPSRRHLLPRGVDQDRALREKAHAAVMEAMARRNARAQQIVRGTVRNPSRPGAQGGTADV